MEQNHSHSQLVILCKTHTILHFHKVSEGMKKKKKNLAGCDKKKIEVYLFLKGRMPSVVIMEVHGEISI